MKLQVIFLMLSEKHKIFNKMVIMLSVIYKQVMIEIE